MGLVAIGVLLLVLGWFFHKVYWTEWISDHRKRSKALAGAAAGEAIARRDRPARPLPADFTSVFREGFGMILFLRALQLGQDQDRARRGHLGLVGVAAVQGAHLQARAAPA